MSDAGAGTAVDAGGGSATPAGGGSATLDLSGASGLFTVAWFDPRNGGALKRGRVAAVKGGGPAALGPSPDSPTEDWLVVVRR